MYQSLLFILLIAGSFFSCNSGFAEQTLKHLRNGEREWDNFPLRPEATSLTLDFTVSADNLPRSLSYQQIDVKQQWVIAINDKPLERLVRDENHMTVVLDIPAEMIQAGTNRLTVKQLGRLVPDDIYVGAFQFHSQTREAYLSQCTLPVEVKDKQTGTPVPCRLTVLHRNGSLMATGNQSTDTTAVRPGVVYTSNGLVDLRLPPGDYTIIAGRGMEWSIHSKQIATTPGTSPVQNLTIQRVVDTSGFVSCDTHVHTFTYSRHGDATLDERLVTIAAEGIELPIATDHNLHIDYGPRTRELNLQSFFTPVIGNEVTTKIGHFNIFPVPAGAPLPDHTGESWAEIVDSIQVKTGASIIILNHARDIHSGVTPFSPERHNSLTGNSFGNGVFNANAMELINSGATQTDVMTLYQDWFGLLNRGINVTGVGCSDSHDVARHFIGQGRTYIRTDDTQPGNIDVQDAVRAFRNGQVNVSYGLFTTMKVAGQFGAGDLATGPRKSVVDLTVQGPGWVNAKQVELYLNGNLLKTFRIPDGERSGVKWTKRVRLREQQKDAFLVAVARGDGVQSLHWPTAKPYQPSHTHFQPYTIGSTGAVKIDFDDDGSFSSARHYAERLVSVHASSQKLITALRDYDVAVAVQAAELLDLAGRDLTSDKFQEILQSAASQVRLGFRLYQRSKLQSVPMASRP